MEEYRPATSLWDVHDKIDFNEYLESDDPRYVPTENARGDFNFTKLYSFLRVDKEKLKFHNDVPPEKVYIAFCGHRGCGKTTELKQLADRLDTSGLFTVIYLSASLELDPNDCNYTDVFMALTNKLIKKIESLDIEINSIYIEKLENWFKQRIIVNESIKNHESEIKAGVDVETGIPFLSKIFANLSTAFRDSSTYKDELRQVIKNNYSIFAEAFNTLIGSVREELHEKTDRKDVLFIVDDLEKLQLEEAKAFFIDNVYQLQQIDGNFIYAVPIDLLYAGLQLQQTFKIITLPMIKIREKDGTTYEKGCSVIRNLIFKRADETLFESRDVVDKIITYSGGNPRHVLQLLEYAYSYATAEKFDMQSVEKAIQDLANDYKRFLTAEDYKLLYELDNSDVLDQSERTRYLLHHLALLEYNSFWWKSHPVIHFLPSYQKYVEQ